MTKQRSIDDVLVKFKLGDKVRIIKSNGNYFWSNAQVGWVQTIDKIDESRNNKEYGYSKYICYGYCWKEDELKLIKRQDKSFARKYTKDDEADYRIRILSNPHISENFKLSNPTNRRKD